MSGTNPLAQFKLTDYTKNAGTSYVAQLDSNAIVSQRVVDQFSAHQQATANMTVVVEPGHILSGTTLIDVGAQTALTLSSGSTAATVLSAAGISNGYVIIASGVSNNATVSSISGLSVTLSTAATTNATVPATFCQVTGVFTAPAGNPRIDRIVADRFTGLISVITGTPGATPAVPAITSGKVPLVQVLLQTSSSSITNSMLTDERTIEAFGRGTAAEYNVGTAAANVVQLDGSAKLPAVDASQLTNFPSGNLTGPVTSVGLATAIISQGVNEGMLGFSNITTANVSTTKHGLCPILPNDATKFLNGTGAYTTPSTQVGFGAWQTLALATVYNAATDGFVVVYATQAACYLQIFTDSSNPPTTARAQTYNAHVNNMFGSNFGLANCNIVPVKKGDYWEAFDTGAGSATVYWIPLGT